MNIKKRGFTPLDPERFGFQDEDKRNAPLKLNKSLVLWGRDLTGFTLIEVMASISILTVGIGGSFILIQQTLIQASLSESKLIAAYLAQEGVEIVRNIRDNNWLQYGNPWDYGLFCCGDDRAACECDREVDYNYSTLTSYSDPGRYLYIDYIAGFYSYIDFPSGDDIKTKFKRKITISGQDLDLEGEEGYGSFDDKMKVQVSVQWEERGKSYSTPDVIEYLYNWNRSE